MWLTVSMTPVVNLLPASTTPVAHIELRIFLQFSTKLHSAIEISGARGKKIHEKNMQSKIKGHCPFNFWKNK
jgi:hypothetical protein